MTYTVSAERWVIFWHVRLAEIADTPARDQPEARRKLASLIRAECPEAWAIILRENVELAAL